MTLSKPYLRSGGNRDRLNPYRVTASLLLKRLWWDLRPVSWKHRRKIVSLRNKYYGKKAIILCNGPSLKDVDFTRIGDVYTFGLNKINLLFEETQFRPSCIVAVNPYVIEQNKDFFSSSDVPLFLDHAALGYGVRDHKSLHLLNSCDFPYFARDCSMSIFQGFTVSYVAMQLAYHMGFTRVALVGCDHYYPYDGVPNTVIRNRGEDLAHFSRDYFSGGDLWQLPDLKASELYYDMARRCFEEDGRLIVNASSYSVLTIFQKTSLGDFLNDN